MCQPKYMLYFHEIIIKPEIEFYKYLDNFNYFFKGLFEQTNHMIVKKTLIYDQEIEVI